MLIIYWYFISATGLSTRFSCPSRAVSTSHPMPTASFSLAPTSISLVAVGGWGVECSLWWFCFRGLSTLHTATVDIGLERTSLSRRTLRSIYDDVGFYLVSGDLEKGFHLNCRGVSGGFHCMCQYLRIQLQHFIYMYDIVEYICIHMGRDTYTYTHLGHTHTHIHK